MRSWMGLVLSADCRVLTECIGTIIRAIRLSTRRVEEAHRQAILEHDIRQLSFIVEYKRNRGDSDDTSRNWLEMMRPNEHRRKRVVVRAAHTEEASQ